MSNLTPNNGWISVNDNLPDSPRQVLIYTDFGGRYVGCYNGDGLLISNAYICKTGKEIDDDQI